MSKTPNALEFRRKLDGTMIITPVHHETEANFPIEVPVARRGILIVPAYRQGTSWTISSVYQDVVRLWMTDPTHDWSQGTPSEPTP